MELFKRYHSIANQTVYTLPTGEKVYPAVVDVKKGMQGGGDISYVETDNNVGFIIVSLVEGESKFKIPSTATVTCNIKRPDGHFLEIACTKMDESTVQIALGSAGTKVEGVHSFDIKIQYSDDIVIGTPIMSYMVQSGLTLDGAIEEDERLPMLTALIEEVKTIHENTNELAEEVSELSENIGAIVEGAGARLDEEIAEFRSQSEELIASANSAVEEVNNSLEQITTSLEEVNQGIDEVNDAISEVNKALEEVNNNMDRIDSVMVEASQAIESMEELQATTIGINEQSESLIAEMQGLIADGLDIEEIADARDGEESLSVRLDRDLQGVYEYVDNKQVDLSSVEIKIAENTNKLNSHERLIDSNLTSIGSLSTRITNNTKTLTSHSTEIANTKQEITTKVNALKTEVDEDIASINDDVVRIQEELSKTENTKYSTENGVKEFSCKDGYVDNIVMEGETLVNLWGKGGEWYNASYYAYCINQNNPIAPDTKLTVFNLSDKQIKFEIYSTSSNMEQHFILPNSSNVITTPSTIHHSTVVIGTGDGWVLEDSDYNYCQDNLVILEGDHTDKPISYFEGLKSVGQGDKIEVLSYNGDNLFNGEFDNGYFNTAVSDKYREELYTDVPTKTTKWIACKPNTEYHIIGGNRRSIHIKNNGSITYFEDFHATYFYNGTTVPLLHTIKTPNDCTHLRVYYERIGEYSAPFKIIEGKCDKKQISTTLRSLPNDVKDTIEKRGNKYYLIQRCKEVELTEDNVLQLTNAGATANTMYFHVFYKGGIKDWAEGNTLCDKFPTNKTPHGINDNQGLWYEDVEGIGYVGLSEDSFRVRIAKNKLSSHNVEGFKAWLKNNPIKVVCELVSPEIIELPNFNPQTYSDNTTLLINSGVIQGECNFEVTNSMGSEIEVLKNNAGSMANSISNMDNSINRIDNSISRIDSSISSIQKIHYSTVTPSSAEGKDGDLWVIYK